MHSVITPVHSLYMVFANAMGLQFLSSYSLPFLYRRMVRDSFHALGVEPVIHMKMSILCIAWCIPSGRCFSSSFGMLSGPGDFPFLRCDNLPYTGLGFVCAVASILAHIQACQLCSPVCMGQYCCVLYLPMDTHGGMHQVGMFYSWDLLALSISAALVRAVPCDFTSRCVPAVCARLCAQTSCLYAHTA